MRDAHTRARGPGEPGSRGSQHARSARAGVTAQVPAAFLSLSLSPYQEGVGTLPGKQTRGRATAPAQDDSTTDAAGSGFVSVHVKYTVHFFFFFLQNKINVICHHKPFL